jgi:hypothetical protein
MDLIGNFSGSAELPVNTPGSTVKQTFDFLNQAIYIDDRMAGKDFRQSIRKTAANTLSGPLGQTQVKLKSVFSVVFEFKTDIVRPLGGISVKGIKELV